jgi:type IV secretory pathway VirD2 relaxase
LIFGGISHFLALSSFPTACLEIMAQDDDFEPRLGRMRALGAGKGRKYLHQVLRAAALAGGPRKGNRSKFNGSQIGRGASVARLLSSRDRHAAFRGRRVVVKYRSVKLAGNGLKGARAHLRYVQRDGVTREGESGQLYSADQDRADGKAFIGRADGDRHQFRFIVSTEDGAEYEDLKPLTRRLMAQVEQDLGTRLDWVAVDHFNTGHPHTHIILRGRNDRGHDLIIAREYLTHGMRERAAELVSLDLGPRTDIEIENRLRQEVGQERLTSIDRRLLRDADDDRHVTASDRDPFQQSIRAGRLQKLRHLGLAEEIIPGHWRLAEGIEDTLRRMGERGDIIRTMQRAYSETGATRAVGDCVIYDPTAVEARPITGRITARGLADELNDRHYLIVDGVDGRSHYVDIGKGEGTEPLPLGAVIRIEPKPAEPRAADRTVVEIAALNGGRYSVDIHLRHDQTASAEFAETHVRRLEAIRRVAGGVEREPDGTWILAPDHLDRAAVYEQRRARDAPVSVQILSTLPVGRQVDADGATWLDRELVAEAPVSLRDGGFGRETRDALARRRQWLIEQELARAEQDLTIYRANMLGILRRRELARVAAQLSDELKLDYAETGSGDRVEGIYRRSVELASGRFAVIEKSREFTLVPWRPVLERNLGRTVSGIAHGETISWTLGRQRGGPSIS